MDCETLASRLTDFLEGDLEAEEEEAALLHLSTCNRCEVVLAETRDVVALTKDHGRVELSDADQEAMLNTLLESVDDGDAAH